MEKLDPTTEAGITGPKAVEPRFAVFAPHIWSALAGVLRTGWVRRGIKNPENVQEHTLELMRIAATLPNLSKEERDGLVDMLEVHDWPEALLGDEVVVSDNAEERERLKALKFEKEKKAMEEMCAGMEHGDEVFRLWMRFETSSDPAAVLARQIDKYQAIEKALEYEKAQGIAVFEEFLNYSRSSITHPSLVAKIEALEAEYQDFKK